jgi:hypothetical protein
VRPSWEWVLDWCVNQPKTWLTVILACALGALGHGQLGTAALAANYALSAAAVGSLLAADACRGGQLSYWRDPGGSTSSIQWLVSRGPPLGLAAAVTAIHSDPSSHKESSTT